MSFIFSGDAWDVMVLGSCNKNVEMCTVNVCTLSVGVKEGVFHRHRQLQASTKCVCSVCVWEAFLVVEK